MIDIGKYFNGFDIAFIENGQYNEKWADIHMMPNETIQAAIDLDTRVFVPIHWGMFDLSLHKFYVNLLFIVRNFVPLQGFL